MLRPRYMPDWQPSWPENVSGIEYEDAQPLFRGHIINDATRISDGTYVSLKILKPSLHPYEVDIATYLSSKHLASDPRNHCVPIYEVLKVPEEDDKVILVMPLLRSWDEPAFETVGEGVDFFRQLFEGLQFIHEQHVAHRDISMLNVLMDGSMYPDGWHPCDSDQMRDNPRVRAKYFSRTERPPKYFFIDFGLSRRYDPKDKAPLELPIRGGDKSVPEFQHNVHLPCNPFPTDIYYVGNLIREGVLKEYKGFEFILPLVSDMVQEDPAKRPTIDQVVSRFADMQKKLGTFKLRARVGLKDDESFGAVRDFAHIFTTIKYALKGLPAVPTR